MIEVKVERATWIRGTKDSWLLNKGRRCCIGFCCQVAGIPDKELQGIGGVITLSNDARKTFRATFGDALLGAAYAINDASGNDDFREERLIEWGERNNIGFEFV